VDVARSDALDLLLLVKGIPFSRSRSEAADWAVGRLIWNLVAPVFEQNLEGRATFQVGTSAIQVAVIIKLEVNGNADLLVHTLQFVNPVSNPVRVGPTSA
jgi:hypothetical protein